MKTLAVIGGTGISELAGLEEVAQHTPETAYGLPSTAITEGLMGARQVYFLQRHGAPHAIPPHLINYRANIAALASLGVTDIVAINAVGGISQKMRPGRLVIPDQLIDYTWGREHTFDDGSSGAVQHIDFTEPYNRQLRRRLIDLAVEESIAHQESGLHGITQGPRLETAAEIGRMAQDGCDIVGMTGMPEASLAKELNLRYACICMVVNPAAGLSELPITLEMMHEILLSEASVVAGLVAALLRSDY